MDDRPPPIWRGIGGSVLDGPDCRMASKQKWWKATERMDVVLA